MASSPGLNSNDAVLGAWGWGARKRGRSPGENNLGCALATTATPAASAATMSVERMARTSATISLELRLSTSAQPDGGPPNTRSYTACQSDAIPR